jgi:hypothetical protein
VDVSDADLTGATESTIEMWIAVANVTVGGEGYMMLSSKYDANNDIRFSFANQGLNITYDDGVEDTASKSSLGWSNNEWHHIVATENNNDGTVILYIDGVEVARKSSGANFDYSGLDKVTYIGIRRTVQSPPYDAPFNGFIDEVRIYNRALSAEEIRYHYNRGGPVAYWKFDEGSGQTAYDFTNNSNDGQLGSTTAADAADPTWIQGKYGSALSFDGVDDYVDCGNDSSLDITRLPLKLGLTQILMVQLRVM